MKKLYAVRILSLFVLALFLELTVFNFRYYESVLYKEVPYKYEYKDKYINVTGIEGNVKNVYLDLTNKKKDICFDVTISAKDEGHSTFYSMPTRRIVSTVEKSKYIKLNLAGECKELKIKIENEGDVELLEFGINQKRCFDFSVLRLILVYVICIVFFVFRHSKDLRRMKLVDDSIEGLIIISLFVCINACLLISLGTKNPTLIKNPYEHQHQYDRLVEAFAAGQVYLKETPPVYLEKLENPYDAVARAEAEAKSDIEYLWDTAYYDGKYYVYFGAVPAVLFYLPVYLVTGRHLPNYMCVTMLAVLLMLGIMGLLRSVIVRYYRKTSLLMYLGLSMLCIWGCNVWYIAKRPDFYTVPIVTALVLSVYGIWLWLSSIREEKISVWRMMLGSLLMALVAGSRPQLILASSIGLILFWGNWKKKHNIFLFFIPYIVVAIVIMWYNNVRFGSPFDFGAAYNLTIDDMTHRGIVLDRVGLGLYSYLFKPFRFSSKFPYIVYHSIETYYQGKTNSENPLSGVLMANLFTWIGFWSLRKRSKFENIRIKLVAMWSVILGIIMTLVDTQMGGIYMRYTSDIAWLFVIGATLCCLEIYSRYYETDVYNIFMAAVKWIFVFTLCTSFLGIFTDVSLTLQNHNPELYYDVAHMVEFWL